MGLFGTLDVTSIIMCMSFSKPHPHSRFIGCFELYLCLNQESENDVISFQCGNKEYEKMSTKKMKRQKSERYFVFYLYVYFCDNVKSAIQ